MSAARTLGSRLAPTPQQQFRKATVTALGTGTVDLAGGLDGDLLAIPHVASLVPAVGDTVLVDIGADGQWLVSGIVDDGNTGRPWREARGSVVITISPAAAFGSAPVTFPAGRFTVPPIVTLGKNASGGRFVPQHQSLTATGFTARVDSGDATTYTGTITVSWHAEQATPTSAAG